MLTNEDKQWIREELKPLDYRVGNLEKDMVDVKADIAELKSDVAELKSDVAGMKSTMDEKRICCESSVAKAAVPFFNCR